MLDKGWGRVINFTGMNAMAGHGGRASVSVAKHGVWGLTKSLAKEFGANGITVNAISPGPIAADDANQKEYSSAQRQQTVGRVPVGRMGTPIEVAAAARLLASEARRLHQRPDDPGQRRRGDVAIINTSPAPLGRCRRLTATEGS